MNLVADESVDGPIVYRLRDGGHRVCYIAEISPGMTDDDILEVANREHAVLLTGDSDFGELVYRRRQMSGGVVLVRLAGLPPARKADIVSAAIAEHASRLVGAFTVISPGQTRIRSIGS